MTEPVYELETATLVSAEDGKPWVVLKVGAKYGPEYEQVIGVLKLTPSEARAYGVEFMEAAEAVEATANLIIALRERKTPEPDIEEIVTTMRRRRGRT